MSKIMSIQKDQFTTECFTNIDVSEDENVASLKWEDGHCSRFHAKWLRFNCHCERCRPDVHGKYRLHVSDFRLNLGIKSMKVRGTFLHVCFENEIFVDHITILPIDWLRKYCYCNDCLEEKISRRDVITAYSKNKQENAEIPTYSYDTAHKDEGLFRILKSLFEVGFCLVKNTPTISNTVIEVARWIAPIQNNHIDQSFEIKANEHKQGVAFTAEELPAHMDQSMYEVEPGIQLLHCIRFDSCVTGGETTIVDAFEAASILRDESPDLFETMTRVPATFSASNKPDITRGHFEHQKTHIVLDYNKRIVAVHWNPVLQTTLQVKEEDVDKYYAAYNKFMQIINRESLKTRYRLEEGDVLFINNRRCTHARSTYILNGGTRHLQVAYMNADYVKNKYVSLGMQLKFDLFPPKIGNSSSY